MKKDNIGLAICLIITLISYFYIDETVTLLSKIGNHICCEYKLYILLWCALVIVIEINIKKYTASKIMIVTWCLSLIISVCSIIVLHLDNNIEISILVFLGLFAIYYTTKLFCSNNEAILTKKQRDLFNRSRFYARIHTTIRRNSKKDESSKVYAIMGEWGSGKTHLIEYLVQRLSKENAKEFFDDTIDDAKDEDSIYEGKYSVCKLEIWKYKSVKQTSQAIIESLNQCVYGEHNIYNWRKSAFITSIVSAILNYCKMSDFSKVVLHTKYEDDVDASKRISEYLARKDMWCVLVMDDMERAKFKILKSILPIIDNLKKINRLIIICSLSEKEAVELFTSNKYSTDSAYGYFRKVFDIPIRMPEIYENQTEKALLHIIEDRYPYCKFLKDFAKKKQLSFTTPREIEQAAISLSSLEIKYLIDKEYLLAEENTKFDYNCIFLIEILRTQFSGIYQFLFENNDYLKRINEIPKRILHTDNFARDTRFSSDNQQDFKSQEEYAKKNRAIYDMILSNPLLTSILRELQLNYSNNSLKVEYAQHMEYINRSDICQQECPKFIHAWVASCHKCSLYNFIDQYYNHPINVDTIQDNILEYLLSNASIQSSNEKIFSVINGIANAEENRILPIFSIEYRRILQASFLIPLIHLYHNTGSNYLYNALLFIIQKIGIYHLYDTFIYIYRLSIFPASDYSSCPFKSSLDYIREHIYAISNSHIFARLASRYGYLFGYHLVNHFENYHGNDYVHKLFRFFDISFFSKSELFMSSFKQSYTDYIKEHATDNQFRENLLIGVVVFLCMKTNTTMPPVIEVSEQTYNLSLEIINFSFGSIDNIHVENFSSKSQQTLSNILLPLSDDWPDILRHWKNNNNPELNYYSGISNAHMLLEKITNSLPKK